MRRSLVLAVLILAGCSPVAGNPPLNTLTSTDSRVGWVSLFDGETLNGWTSRGNAQWQVDDGAITVTPGSGTGYLATNRAFDDFRLQFDFYAGEGSNSDIYLRAPTNEPATAENSFAVRISDESPQGQAGLVIQVQALTGTQNAVNRWSHLDVTVTGFHFTVHLDGRQIVSKDGPSRLTSGVIMLSPTQGELRVRNIRLQPLTCFGCAHPSTYD